MCPPGIVRCRRYNTTVRAVRFNSGVKCVDYCEPSPAILKQNVEKAGLTLDRSISFGQDYARTLNNWHKRFLSVWEELQQMGFDDQFKKLWEFYLAYCEAGFRAETTDVCQVSLVRA